MEILTFLSPLLQKMQDPSALVPSVLCIFLGYLHVIWRREEREDRAKLVEAFTKVTEAMNEIRIAVAAITGKAV